LCLVELRGLEPLTPCMPSRDPHHGTHHKALRGRALHQRGRAGGWWYVRLRRAELLRACCAKWLGTGVDATPRSLARMGVGASGSGWAMTVTVALAGDTMLGRGAARALATTPPQALVALEVRDALGEADLVVLNLECCISERGRPWEAHGKPFFFRAPPRAGELLALLATDCVTLANSHALDYGVAAAGRLVLADPPLAAVANQDTGLSRRPEQGRSVELPDRQPGPGYVVTFARGCSSCARSPVDAVLPTCIHFWRPTRPRAGGATPVRCADRR
jgi:hypothetical protein